MSVVLPINPDDRYRIITASAGQTVLAISFPWQDNNDVDLLKADADGYWVPLSTPADFSLAGAGNPSGGSATLTVAALAGDRFLALGSAVLDRLSSIVRDGKFSSKLIDDEFDRNRIIQQEQSRDLDRAVKVDFGESGLTIDTGLADGDTLMKSGERLVKGANALDIANAQANAAIATAAASAAAASAATINLPPVTANTFLRAKADATGYDKLTANQVASELNVPQKNSDGGLSLVSTTTNIPWNNGVFGGAWQTANRRESSSTATFAGARATEAVVRTVTGSGSNGPAFADCASFRSVLKSNYLTSVVDGEIDGDFISVAQGANGDCSAILSNTRKVGGGTGAAIAYESSVDSVDNLGAIVRGVQTLKNFQEGAGGVSGGKGYGFYAEARVGDPYSAYHADQAQTGAGAVWANFLTYTRDRSAASMIYKVDGAGRINAGNGGGALPAYSFVSDPNTGMSRIGEDQLGFSAGGAYRFYVDTGAFVPATDNAYSLGRVSTGRVSNIYTVNAPTVGSDARSKTDIVDTPLGLDFILALRPVAYRLKEGGITIEMIDVEELVDEPVTEEGDVWIDESYYEGRKKVKKHRHERQQIPVYDHEAVLDGDGAPLFEDVSEPVFDADGLPVMEAVPQPPFQYRDVDGNVYEQPQPPMLVQVQKVERRPVLRAVPRMQTVKKIAQVPVEVPVPGKRQHFGLLAQEVRASLPEGIDFGGWLIDDLEDADSKQALRYEEFISPLIKAIQQLHARIEDLEAELRA